MQQTATAKQNWLLNCKNNTLKPVKVYFSQTVNAYQKHVWSISFTSLYTAILSGSDEKEQPFVLCLNPKVYCVSHDGSIFLVSCSALHHWYFLSSSVESANCIKPVKRQMV